jgi:hypothetical protein
MEDAMNDSNTTYLRLSLIDMARGILDVTERMIHPYTWEVECRRSLQSTARQLIEMAKTL